MEGSGKKGKAGSIGSLPLVGRAGEGQASSAEPGANTPPGPAGHPPHKGEEKSLFTKPSLDDMGPGTDMTRPARKPADAAGGFRKPTLEDIGHNIAVPARGETSLFRKNTLDEMTVGRTEKPLNTTGKLPEKPVTEPSKRFSPLLEGQPEKRAPSSSPQRGEDSSPQEAKPIGSANLVRGADDPKPFIRAKSGAGSYEDAGDLKRQKKTKGKTGRPGQ